MAGAFKLGIDTLLGGHSGWVRNRRVALLSHSAAIDRTGRTTLQRLYEHPEINLVCALSPEHGFFASAPAGEHQPSTTHPVLKIPIHSLYGQTREPSSRMLAGIDVIVIDLANLPIRCYTYVSTILLCLRAAADKDIEVIVADRPVPLASTTNGPPLAPSCHSFVSLVDTPFCYGMTPAETARWLVEHENLSLQLRIARCNNYQRDSYPAPTWPPWTPPSPAILSWESALCYPATVLLEALPALDHGRHTLLPFQIFGARWTHGEQLSNSLNNCGLQGVSFCPHTYQPSTQPTGSASVVDGVRLHITNPQRYAPADTAVAILHTLQEEYGQRRVWRNARTAFFDKLAGNAAVRAALSQPLPVTTLRAQWKPLLSRFRRSRAKVLMY